MNGKSNNMNNVLQQIYPTGCYIPPDELIAVFDADQVRCGSFTGQVSEPHCWLLQACRPPAACCCRS